MDEEQIQQAIQHFHMTVHGPDCFVKTSPNLNGLALVLHSSRTRLGSKLLSISPSGVTPTARLAIMQFRVVGRW